MTRRWAEAGNQISKTSEALNTPVSCLCALRLGARLAGSFADALDSSLKGLGDQLAEAKWKGGPIRTLLNQFHIGFQGLHGEARTGADALGDVAEAVSSLRDPHAKLHLLQQLGISEDLLPMLDKGRAGLEKFVADAQRTGGVMTQEMADNARKMHASWTELGEAIEGVGNRIVNSWSGTATRVIDTTSQWIEEQEKLGPAFDRNVLAVMGAIGALGALRIAPWILRAMGWLLPGEAVPFVAPLALKGDTADNPEARVPYDPVSNPNLFDRYGAFGSWFLRQFPWLGGSGPRLAGPRASGLGSPGAAEPAVPYQAGAILGGMGITAGQYSAFREGIARIEHARYDQMGGSSNRFAGRYQMGAAEIAETARRLFVPVPTREQFLSDPAMQERFFEAYTAAHNDQLMRESARYRAMTPSERLEVLGYAHNQGVGGAEAWLETGQVGRDAFRTPGTAYSDAVAESLGAANRSTAPAGAPPVGPLFGPQGGPFDNRFSGGAPPIVPQADVSGHVQVDIRLHGAPVGTTATAVSSGAARVVPPRIETSMPLAR